MTDSHATVSGGTAAPVIEGRGLARTFTTGGVDVLALRDVDIAVHPGEFVAVMGPSGSGKSTLLNLLGGLERPSAGQVTWRGERIDQSSETRLARLRRRTVGFVFQFFNLVPSLTAAENVELAVLLAGASRAAARTRAAELLGRMDLADHAGRSPGQLSGGQQQRLAVARALANRPAVVLADEPTGNLDSAAAREVLDALREGREDGQALLLVTHDPRVAAAADRVVTMADGLVSDETEVARGRPVPSLLSLGPLTLEGEVS
ncbi:MAG: ABC transporter ATP-binding protein [Acidimicrobiales bacterium]